MAVIGGNFGPHGSDLPSREYGLHSPVQVLTAGGTGCFLCTASMGKRIKKGTKGEAAAYITRTQALRKLQCSLKDFRRLCILKGVYPRTPKKTLKGRDKTYYLAKDIRFLTHEPLLDHIQRFRVWKRKLASAKGRAETSRAAKIAEHKPVFRLDNILRERYPSLEDAVHDLDDALSTVHLFSALPARSSVPGSMIEASTRLAAEWQCWVASARALRKVFLSIKGVYFQADVRGVAVTWIVPWPYLLTMPKHVDPGVMMTFNDLHAALLRFVLFRLYTDTGRNYPPAPALPVGSAPLFATVSTTDATDVAADADGDAATAPQQEMLQDGQRSEEEACKHLFDSCVVFISREVPVGIFALMVRACGGRVGWEGSGSPFEANDPAITHHVCDRPVVHRFLTREYVQPQWIADCINARLLLPTVEYLPGTTLPPHLSPFVNNSVEGYTPARALQIKEMQKTAGVSVAEPPPMQIIAPKASALPVDATAAAAAPAVSGDAKQKKSSRPKRSIEAAAEAAAEAGQAEPPAPLDPEARKRARMLMPKKTRLLYDKMQHGIKEKEKAIRKLENKRAAGDKGELPQHRKQPAANANGKRTQKKKQ